MHYKHMSTTVYYKLDFVHETANKLCYHGRAQSGQPDNVF